MLEGGYLWLSLYVFQGLKEILDWNHRCIFLNEKVPLCSSTRIKYECCHCPLWSFLSNWIGTLLFVQQSWVSAICHTSNHVSQSLMNILLVRKNICCSIYTFISGKNQKSEKLELIIHVFSCFCEPKSRSQTREIALCYKNANVTRALCTVENRIEIILIIRIVPRTLSIPLCRPSHGPCSYFSAQSRGRKNSN